jgi:hypothetical protein
MLPRRGSRPLDVDGHALRWWVIRRGVRGCPDCDECSVVLAAASRTGSVVRVYIPDAWRDEVAPITPARVAALARKALRRGWVPGQGQGEFAGALGDLPPEPA